jgi:hypothetical protein
MAFLEFYTDAETFHCRLRATSKSLLFQLLHVEQDVSVYQSTGECLYFSVLNLISQYLFFMCIYKLIHITETKKVQTVIKKYIMY